MKKYITAAVLIVTVIIITAVFQTYKFSGENRNQTAGIFGEISPTPLVLPHGEITEKEYNNDKYLIFSVKVPKSADISIIPNFSEKFTGEKLTDDNNCDLSINGGFYLPDDKPLGYFYSDNSELGKPIKSNIANAFVTAKKNGEIIFSRELPEETGSVDFSFQTGPFIIPANLQLRLTNDEKTRRSLLGKDEAGNLYLVSVTRKDDVSGGPNLADIPVIFYELRNILPLKLIINLDGGSASFFHSADNKNNLTLPSWAPVGSLICIKIRG